jgi:hypothetical protein
MTTMATDVGRKYFEDVEVKDLLMILLVSNVDKEERVCCCLESRVADADTDIGLIAEGN